MRRGMTFLPESIVISARCSLLVLLLGSFATAASEGEVGSALGSAESRRSDPSAVKSQSPGARDDVRAEFVLTDLEAVRRQVGRALRQGANWYRRTPPGERMCWGGLVGCALLAWVVVLERGSRLRRRKIIPAEFTARFIDRLHEGKLDGGKALDYCEMNPSPAARIALAAVRRWGRPAADLERAVTLAHRAEAEQLRRNVGTLRRIAVLAPLLGLLGLLLAAGRVLAAVSPSVPLAESPTLAAGSPGWGPELAAALVPFTLGVALATLALVAYDALVTRIERLSGALDRLGAETIDAIAMATPPAPRALLSGPAGSRMVEPHAGHGFGTSSPIPSNHQDQSVSRRANEGGRQRPSKEQSLGF